jgi:hypothetical protein|tara:strand:- start:1628 stop:1822 length:195 start_codon:yes stop_codon:yes gene_type:complete
MNKQELDEYLEAVGFSKYNKSFRLDVPTSSLKGVEAVTDILIDEYHETETFIKELFNSNSMEAI